MSEGTQTKRKDPPRHQLGYLEGGVGSRRQVLGEEGVSGHDIRRDQRPIEIEESDAREVGHGLVTPGAGVGAGLSKL